MKAQTSIGEVKGCVCLEKWVRIQRGWSWGGRLIVPMTMFAFGILSDALNNEHANDRPKIDMARWMRSEFSADSFARKAHQSRAKPRQKRTLTMARAANSEHYVCKQRSLFEFYPCSILSIQCATPSANS